MSRFSKQGPATVGLIVLKQCVFWPPSESCDIRLMPCFHIAQYKYESTGSLFILMGASIISDLFIKLSCPEFVLSMLEKNCKILGFRRYSTVVKEAGEQIR